MEKLKKCGKYAIKFGVPVAIGLFTGGAGFGLALTPLISKIFNDFEQSKISVPDQSKKAINKLFEEISDEGLEKVIESIINANKKDNPNVEIAVQKTLIDPLSEIRDSINIMKDFQVQPSDLKEIFSNWITEERHLVENIQNVQTDHIEWEIQTLNLLQSNFDSRFEQISTKLDDFREEVKEDVKNINETMINIQKILYKNLLKNNLLEQSKENLFVTSQIQFKTTQLRSKKDIPFDPNLFISTPALDKEFKKFLGNAKNPLFLLLANMGMGKTWNVVHLGLIAQSSPELQTLPFFLPLNGGFTEQLHELFGKNKEVLAVQVGDTCEKIYNSFDHLRVLLIFDGLDELNKDLLDHFLLFITKLMFDYSKYVRVLLTDRLVHWIIEDKIYNRYSDFDKLLFVDNQEGNNYIHHNFGKKFEVSWFIKGFYPEQIEAAIARYNLDRSNFSPELFDLSSRPYILQIVKENNMYFDPKDGLSFSRIFIHQKSSQSIADRMELGSPMMREYFFNIIKAFDSFDQPQPADRLNSALGSTNDEKFVRLMCSGILIREIQRNLFVFYSVDKPFIPCLKYFKEQLTGNPQILQVDDSELHNELKLMLSVLKENESIGITKFARMVGISPEKLLSIFSKLNNVNSFSIMGSNIKFFNIPLLIQVIDEYFSPAPLNIGQIQPQIIETDAVDRIELETEKIESPVEQEEELIGNQSMAEIENEQAPSDVSEEESDEYSPKYLIKRPIRSFLHELPEKIHIRSAAFPYLLQYLDEKIIAGGFKLLNLLPKKSRGESKGQLKRVRLMPKDFEKVLDSAVSNDYRSKYVVYSQVRPLISNLQIATDAKPFVRRFFDQQVEEGVNEVIAQMPRIRRGERKGVLKRTTITVDDVMKLLDNNGTDL